MATKADGTFAIANEEPRLSNLSFLATADGGAYQGIFRFDDMMTGPKDARTLVRIVLKPARTVTVSVVDGHGARSKPQLSRCSIWLFRSRKAAPMHAGLRRFCAP